MYKNAEREVAQRLNPSAPKVESPQEKNTLEVKSLSNELYIITFVFPMVFNKNINGNIVVIEIKNKNTSHPRYVRISGRWIEHTQYVVGASIIVNTKFQRGSFGEFYKDADEGIVSNDSGSLILYPYYICDVGVVTSGQKCLRKGFIQSKVNFDRSQKKVVINKILQKVLIGYIGLNPKSSNAKLLESKTNVSNIVNDIILKYRSSIFLSGENETTITKKIYSKLYFIFNDTNKSPGFSLIGASNREITPSRMFPVLSQDSSYIQTLYSFNLGLKSKLNAVIETINDEKLPMRLYPHEKEPLTVTEEHIGQISGDLALLRSRYPDDAADSGFVWYYQSIPDSRYVVRPDRQESLNLICRRNDIVSYIALNGIPERVISSECDTCNMKTHCDILVRMELQVPQGEFSQRVPSLFGSSSEAEFFWKHYDRVSKSSLGELEAYTHILTSSIEQRVSLRTCAPNLLISSVESDADKQNTFICFDSPSISYFKSLSVRKHNSAIITAADRPSVILGVGVVQTITDKQLILLVYDHQVSEQERVNIDFFDWKGDHRTRMLSLFDMFRSNSKIVKLLMDKNFTPKFSSIVSDYDKQNLTVSEVEAVEFALTAKDVALIDAPPDSGFIKAACRIAESHWREGKVILVSCSYYYEMNSISEFLESKGIKFAIFGKTKNLDMRLQKYVYENIVAKSESIAEAERMLAKTRVFVTQLQKRSILDLSLVFDVVISLDFNCQDILLSLPVYKCCEKLVIFGNSVLENENCAFAMIRKLHPNIVKKLNEVYNTHPDIADVARIFYGSEHKSLLPYVGVGLDGLKVLEPVLSNMMSFVLSMERPMFIIEVSDESFAVLVAVCAGIVFEKVILSCPSRISPACTSIIARMSHNADFFSNQSEYMSRAASRVSVIADTLAYQTFDVGIFVGGSPESVKSALSFATKKAVFVLKKGIINADPGWENIRPRLPKHSVIDIKDGFMSVDHKPFKSFDAEFRSIAISNFDIEDI